MRSTLFHIPSRISLGELAVPVFGWGVLLVAVAFAAVIGAAVIARRDGWTAAIRSLAVPVGLAAAMILFVLPSLDDGQGVPVRGYGVMLLLAATAGTWLSIERGKRMGFDADTILSLATVVFLWGLVGARLFYVIEYHERFFGPGMTLRDSLAAIVNISAGGLVVFGSLPTAGVAAWLFARGRSLDFARLLDCVAPGLLVGLALGRVGCFLNGCCYGGPCELPWAVRFPPESPPWIDQAQRGLLPGAADGASWSLPIHPAQLYAAIDAALLAAVAIAWTPLARRDGEVFAVVLTLHPVSRILLERIRVDEAPALGTPFSISELVSLVLLLAAALLWGYILRSPVRPAPCRERPS
jgi:phosphatidylglycerol:prolipoprotein diacylglycerol transferase